MVIVWQTTHGAYTLTEVDGTVFKLRFAAFCVIPYHAWEDEHRPGDVLYSPIPMKRWKM
jgi:hypothetical protein